MSQYLNSVFRQFKSRPGQWAMNIIGLSLACVVALGTTLFLIHETSYDRHQPKSQETYRLVTHFPDLDDTRIAPAAPNMGPELKEQFSQVSDFTRISLANENLSVNGDTSPAPFRLCG